MNHAPGLSHRHDILSKYAESGLPSVEAFAEELGVSREWVRYWLELAELKRRQHANGHRDATRPGEVPQLLVPPATSAE